MHETPRQQRIRELRARVEERRRETESKNARERLIAVNNPSNYILVNRDDESSLAIFDRDAAAYLRFNKSDHDIVVAFLIESGVRVVDAFPISDDRVGRMTLDELTEYLDVDDLADYVLLKSEDSDGHLTIINIRFRTMLLIESSKEHDLVVQDMLRWGVPVVDKLPFSDDSS